MAGGSRDNVPPEKAIFSFITWESGSTGGDDENINPDASVTPSVFSYTAPAGGAYIQRINFLLVDALCALGKFGGINGGITNGITVKATEEDGSTVALDFLEGYTIKKNEQFNWLAGVDVAVADGNTVSAVPIRWTLSKAFGKPFHLKAGAKIQIGISDDLSGLTEFRAQVQGEQG